MTASARLLVLCALAGCSLFKELQSAESADAGDGSGTAGSGSGTDTDTDEAAGSETSAVCEIVADDECADQDTLHSCDPATGVLTTYSCPAVCGANLNFTCVMATGDARHACWCVVPGEHKNASCSELEGCMRSCSGTTDTSCADKCFSRTTASTIRIYGALVHCAHDGCLDTCHETPENCAPCIDYAVATGGSSCVVERSICDSDEIDEPWPAG